MTKISAKAAGEPPVLGHGGRVLPAVTVDAYNEELRDEDGFVGDRASGRAFRAILEDWRDQLRRRGGWGAGGSRGPSVNEHAPAGTWDRSVAGARHTGATW